MWLLFGQTIWFFLPAGIANMGASLSRYLPIPDWPVDGGVTWRGHRIFGSHKTWRGLIVGTIVGVLFFWLQQYLYQFAGIQSISLIDYSSTSWVFGLLLAAGGVLGDLVKSFFKRQINVAPGTSWMPFDQIDYVVGAAILVALIYVPGWQYIVTALSLGFILHIVFNLIGYILHLQKNKL